ncbi:MAG: ribosome silencing factor [Pseudomonadales bacterium]
MQATEIAALAEQALEDLKAQNIQRFDVRALTDIADFLIIASGTSNRQVKALAENVQLKAKQAGLSAIGVEGADTAEWILVDLADVVVHVMQPATREFYDLERLWSVPPAPAADEQNP